jgi:hypothetical protein
LAAGVAGLAAKPASRTVAHTAHTSLKLFIKKDHPITVNHAAMFWSSDGLSSGDSSQGQLQNQSRVVMGT